MWFGIGSILAAIVTVMGVWSYGPYIWPVAPSLGTAAVLTWLTLPSSRPRSATVGAVLGSLVLAATALLFFTGA